MTRDALQWLQDPVIINRLAAHLCSGGGGEPH